ncbi:uncharacterized protein LOC134257132 [Saccostrea cucullata]|uniref:uncharacterized protein LOC134257132 n=1 Tax=Saccostrea cuccullata TaxID=36930 RepID=UPI002ED60362
MMYICCLVSVGIVSVLIKDAFLCITNGTQCCADFYNDNGECKECPVGYFGPNCTHRCQYPRYGRRCLQGNCNCSKEECSLAVGCDAGHEYSNWTYGIQSSRPSAITVTIYVAGSLVTIVILTLAVLHLRQKCNPRHERQTVTISTDGAHEHRGIYAEIN